MSIEYVYQSSGMYEDGNKITITGWDYNIIIKKKDLSSKTKNVR